jgi:hypothetical protein
LCIPSPVVRLLSVPVALPCVVLDTMSPPSHGPLFVPFTHVGCDQGTRAQAQLQERMTQLDRINRELEAGTPQGPKSGSLRVIRGQEE